MQSLPPKRTTQVVVAGMRNRVMRRRDRGAILSICALLAAPLVGRAQNVSFALAHVTVIDMTGAPPQSDMTVVVTGNRIATVGPSHAVRIPKGGLTLDAGKLADLVLLDADPIADIHNTTKINAVVLDGQLLDQAARQRLLDFVRMQAALPAPDSARH